MHTKSLVETQKGSRRPANGIHAEDLAVIRSKMRLPLVEPGMIETDELASEWVKSPNVCSLTQIALKTGIGKVILGGCAAVTERQDVIDVVRDSAPCIGQQTILASMLCTSDDMLAKYS